MMKEHFLVLGFCLLFLSSCNSSGVGDSSTPASTCPAPPSSGGAIHISGTLTYDFVSASTAKLNYAGTIQKPMRNVYVELLYACNGSVISSTNTNDSGAYDLAMSTSADVKIRIYAEMISPAVIVQDNTSGYAEYALATSTFTASASTTKNINASSGWSGTNAGGAYTSSRTAAPFAILDSIYTITKKINTVRPAITFPTLKINWSVNNIASSGDETTGHISTSHYSSSTNQLYILGKADVDTDEYDNHVIVHEWGHFLEFNLSRSDSSGGSHGFGDEKEMSLAFGEGWGNAVSAMAFDPDVYYSDTNGSRQQSGFRVSLEAATDTNKGWFSEVSVQEILYDIYDSTNEANDNLSLGIGPIIDVFTGYQKTTSAMTSLFSFIYGLKTNVPGSSADIDTLLASKNISSITDPYGTGETNNGGWALNLPIYNSLTLGGAAAAVSLYGSNGGSDFYGLYNSVFNNKYISFTASSVSTRLVVTASDTFELDVYKNGSSISSYTQIRSSAGAFGPFTYTLTTTPGSEYIIQILTDQSYTFSTAKVNLTITGTAL